MLGWRWARTTPLASWLQARVPMRMAATLMPPEHRALSSDGKRVIERSIPYAGYMALTAIWLVLADKAALLS
ncbi:hypothetical protein D3C71_2131250 [compost metagenome]